MEDVAIRVGISWLEFETLDSGRKVFYESGGTYNADPVEGEDFEIGWKREEGTGIAHVA